MGLFKPHKQQTPLAWSLNEEQVVEYPPLPPSSSCSNSNISIYDYSGDLCSEDLNFCPTTQQLRLQSHSTSSHSYQKRYTEKEKKLKKARPSYNTTKESEQSITSSLQQKQNSRLEAQEAFALVQEVASAAATKTTKLQARVFSLQTELNSQKQIENANQEVITKLNKNLITAKANVDQLRKRVYTLQIQLEEKEKMINALREQLNNEGILLSTERKETSRLQIKIKSLKSNLQEKEIQVRDIEQAMDNQANEVRWARSLLK